MKAELATFAGAMYVESFSFCRYIALHCSAQVEPRGWKLPWIQLNTLVRQLTSS
jgi:hypothetical protein